MFEKLEANITDLQTAHKDLLIFQRNAPTKQYINYAMNNQRQQQPAYYALPGGASGIPNASSDAMKKVPLGCSEVVSPTNATGIYRIRSSLDAPVAFYAYCDLSTEAKKWTVILKRDDGVMSFYRNWIEFKNGFGNVYAEFWIGLDKLREVIVLFKSHFFSSC